MTFHPLDKKWALAVCVLGLVLGTAAVALSVVTIINLQTAVSTYMQTNTTWFAGFMIALELAVVIVSGLSLYKMSLQPKDKFVQLVAKEQDLDRDRKSLYE